MNKIINCGTFAVNTWVIDFDGSLVVIDTGYKGGFESFKRRLEGAGYSLPQIAFVFLTHAHDDHAGFLNELLFASAAAVVLHPAAFAGLARGQNSFEGGCSNKRALVFCNLMKLAGKGAHRFPPLEEVLRERCLPLNGKTELLLKERFGLTVLQTPGHTGCSISLMLKSGEVFCGDAAMNGFPSQNRVTIWVENLTDYCASWKKIIAANPSRIFPGHGRPFAPQDLVANLERARKRVLLPLGFSPESRKNAGK